MFAASLLLASPARAFDNLETYARAEAAHLAGELVLKSDGKSRTITLDELETLPLYELTGNASPDEPLIRFQGPLLKDVVKLIGAEDAASLTLRATDNYAIDIPRKDWESWPVLLATRAEGKPISTRQRGPARVIYPIETHPELDPRIYSDRSIWMLEQIEWQS